jgi:predicted SnoaL-like aldol condensation-catalyzing enzyme
MIMAKNRTRANKHAAIDFLRLVVAGRIDEAYRIYVDVRGKHHNPFFAAGFAALQKAMEDDQAKSPGKTLAVKNALGDGDLVAVHSHLVFRPDDPGMAVVHLFRFREGRIVEMWDCGMPAPADSPNADGMF